MYGEIQCWSCVYGENRTGEPSCHNGTVQKLRQPPDKYDCEFYDEISDDYEADMVKVVLSRD